MTTTLVRDKDWKHLDGDLCKVSSFTPWASVMDGKVISSNKTLPYAVIEIDEVNFHKLPEPLVGYISHSMDFTHLWHVFEDRGVQEDEVVAVTWTKQHYKSIVYKLLSVFMPRLVVWIFTQEGYRLWDNDYRPDYRSLERYEESRPILELKPPVM
jgi:hypothetical protein